MSQKQGVATVAIVVVVLTAVTATAWVTGRWVLTALPIGVVFGFFLQKGDLCGASAFSEVVLTRDGRKVWGLWVAIVVSMVGVAIGDLAGWIQLNPKPLILGSAIVGGIFFGIGMVLAGGCVSGCLYKGATGNLNSLVALLAMPAGIGLVEYGPLHGLFVRLTGLKIPAADGGPVTLSSLTGLPFWLLTLLVAAATFVGAMVIARHRESSADVNVSSGRQGLGRFFSRSWRPWQAGIAIGLLALPAYLSSAATGRNYPLGVTHGVLFASVLVTDAPVQHVVGPAPKDAVPAVQTETVQPVPRKKVVWWLVLLVAGVMIGSNISGRLSGQAKLLPKPPEQVLVAILGGFLVGAGAALATGCVIGNILSGWALMSVGMFLFGTVTILANWATTALYLRGIR